MKDKKKKDRYSKVAWVVAGSALTVADAMSTMFKEQLKMKK